MDKICLGILAHVDAGKTTLSESILYNSGTIRSMGRVDKGDAFLDTDIMEKERGITIFSKQARFSLGARFDITLLDTPGHVDFSPEAERTLWVLDYAVLVVSASDGVTGHTKTLFSLLERYKVPTFIFVNKMDQNGADKEQVLDTMKRELSDYCIAFEDTSSGSFYEEVALAEEELMESYLATEQVEDEEIIRLISERKIFPVYYGSALKNTGVIEFMEGLAHFIKASSDKGSQEFGARVFKITRDDKGNRLTHIKVTGGGFKVRDIICDDEKITGIRLYSGDRFETVPDASVNGVYALCGLTKTYGGQGLGFEVDAPGAVLEPVMTYKVILPYPGESEHDAITDPAQMMIKLNELCEDMPEIHAIWDEELKEIHVSIMGDVQLEILKRVIADRYDTDVTFGAGKIVYKETIASVVEGVGHFEPLRHYAEVHLKLEPLERGAGIQVVSEASTDELALNWQRLITTHVLERNHRGVLTGAVVTDMKVTLLAGRAHPKHTMGGDFRQATYRAIRQGLMQAENVLLEPYYSFNLCIPDSYVGRAMTDLDRRSAKFEGPYPNGDGTQTITGSAPVSVLQDYPSVVSAYSGGKGTLTCTLKGYDVCHNAEDVIWDRMYDPEADLRNTPDSVFCSHGAGVVVSWKDVFEHMHIPPQLYFDEDGLAGRVYVDEQEELLSAAMKAKSTSILKQQQRDSYFMGYEEVDDIIAKASGANLNSGKRENTAGLQARPGWKKAKGAGGAYDGAQTKVKRVYKPQPKRDEYMLVDGYNVIHAWKELSELAGDNLDGARGRLLDILCNYQGIKQMNLIAVFDAYKVKGKVREIEDYHNIHVVYTKEAETADAYIEKFTHENSHKYDITVVTSDGVEQVIIMGAGCKLMSSREFEVEVQRMNEIIRREHIDGVPEMRNTFMDNLSKESKQLITHSSEENNA